jgi:3-deoxy-7-phosphoheptulonate synthase
MQETIQQRQVESYRRVARQNPGQKTIVNVEGVRVGGPDLVVIAGPCAIEAKEHFLESARQVSEAGADIIRGGAFKPRASPYSFQGLGEEGLTYLSATHSLYHKPTVTEATGERTAALVATKSSIIQIGSKNSQNYDLLKYVGELSAKRNQPVLLKRHYAGSIVELLQSAEYIANEGGERTILCLRGTRTTDNPTNGGSRYTPDFYEIPTLRKMTHLPIIADVSHPAGDRSLVLNYAMQAVAAGADGLMIESCIDPESARCDARQMVTPQELGDIVQHCRGLHQYLSDQGYRK